MYSDKMINQIYYEKLNSLNARCRIQRDLKYAVSKCWADRQHFILFQIRTFWVAAKPNQAAINCCQIQWNASFCGAKQQQYSHVWFRFKAFFIELISTRLEPDRNCSHAQIHTRSNLCPNAHFDENA